jgi:hypothetical protein
MDPSQLRADMTMPQIVVLMVTEIQRIELGRRGPGLASRFYKSLNVVLARRLRETSRELA